MLVIRDITDERNEVLLPHFPFLVKSLNGIYDKNFHFIFQLIQNEIY